MGKFERYKWKMITSYSDGTTVEQPTYRKMALDLGLKCLSASLCGAAFYLIGNYLDYESGTKFSNYILVPAGMMLGFIKSGSEASNPDKINNVRAFPFYKNL